MAFLEAIMKTDECDRCADDDSAALRDEMCVLRQKLVTAFLPFVRTLVAARLLTACVNIEHEEKSIIMQFTDVEGTAHTVVDNGNIWLVAYCEGGACKKGTELQQPKIAGIETGRVN